jgi:hypothetical protein
MDETLRQLCGVELLEDILIVDVLEEYHLPSELVRRP